MVYSIKERKGLRKVRAIHKNTILIIGIVAVIVIFHTFTQKKIEVEMERICTSSERIMIYIENNSYDSAKNEVKEIKDRWEGQAKVFATFVEHKDIEIVRVYICAMENYLDQKDHEKAYTEARLLMCKTAELSERGKIRIENIF